MIEHIDHVVLFVTDMSQAIDFYTNSLGLDIQYKSKEYTSISTGGQTGIGLHIAENVVGNNSGKATTQVSFAVNDIKRARENLQSKEVEITNEIQEIAPGRFMFNFIDPDGNQLLTSGNFFCKT